MRTLGKIAVVLALLAAAAAGFLLRERPADRGTRADSAGTAGPKEWADFTLPDTGGERISLGRFIGKKPVLLVFWATWCPQCKESVPVINRMHAEPPTRDALSIFALDFMESREQPPIQERESPFA